MPKGHNAPCFCGQKKSYEHCCGRFISGQLYPSSPEELMRSRYSAYAQAQIGYIVETMRGPAAQDFDQEASRQWAQSVKWIGLQVYGVEQGPNDNVGYVEFVASYREGGVPAQKIHERSEFHRIEGRWYYWSAAPAAGE